MEIDSQHSARREEGPADLTMAPDGTLTGSVTGTGGEISVHGTVSISDGWVSGGKFSFTINLTIEGNPGERARFQRYDWKANSYEGAASGSWVIPSDFSGVHPGAQRRGAMGLRRMKR